MTTKNKKYAGKSAVARKKPVIKFRQGDRKGQSGSGHDNIESLALNLAQEFHDRQKSKSYTSIKYILSLAASGVLNWLEDDATPSNFRYTPISMLFTVRDPEARTISKRFDIPRVKQSLAHLENQKLIKVIHKEGKQIVSVTEKGRTKILSYAIDEMTISKEKRWDGTWWMVSYDLSGNHSDWRHSLRARFLKWGFYPLHKSVYLHAFPCHKEVDFLRQLYGLGRDIKIFHVKSIENDDIFRQFFKVQVDEILT